MADDLENPAQVLISEIRYGKWSQKIGLKHGPLHPPDDFKRLEHRGEIVYEHLLKVYDQLPFPFKAHYEYCLSITDNLSLYSIVPSTKIHSWISARLLAIRPGLPR